MNLKESLSEIEYLIRIESVDEVFNLVKGLVSFYPNDEDVITYFNSISELLNIGYIDLFEIISENLDH